MKVNTHHGEMHQSRGDYGDAISHHRRPISLNRIAAVLLLIAAFGGSLVLPTACVPDAQAEAEAVAASVQDAQTAAMQEAIGRNCAGLDQRSELQCALDTLQELQPERWIPEDAARAALAVPFATTTEKE